MIHRWILWFVLLVLLTSSAHSGRGDKAGMSAASELLIPVGARSIALGGASIATISGIEAIYWNPAGLTRSRTNLNVTFSYMKYFADMSVDYFAGSINIPDLVRVGLAIKSLSVGDIQVTTEDFPDGTGERTSPTFMIIGGTIAREISDRISIGVTSNLIIEKMGRVSATGIAFNAGVQYAGIGGVDRLNVGVVLKNLGPSLRYDGSGLLRDAEISDATRQSSLVKIQAAASDLPSIIEVGLGYSMIVSQKGVVNITSLFQNNNFSDDEYKLGVEYIYNDIIFFRTGYDFSSVKEGGEYIFGPTFGIGVHSMVREVEISLHYAYRSVKYFDGSHVFSFDLEF